MDSWKTLRDSVFSLAYRRLLKPILFRIDPERIHAAALSLGEGLGERAVARRIASLFFSYSNVSLRQTVAGMRFENPVGLAAGFDKDARLSRLLPEMGFGFMELGSVTGEACAGNPGRWLWRLPKSKSILVNIGLKNSGARVIAARLAERPCAIPLGISLARTNCPETVELKAGIDDFVKAYAAFARRGLGSYFTLNISCPNAFGGESFLEAQPLDDLLAAITFARLALRCARPIFLKLPAALPSEHINSIIETARRYHIAGFICTNLLKGRPDTLADQNVPAVGSLSGLPVQKHSDELIRYIYERCGQEFVLIGCGGIFSAEDAYRKIRSGASLLQLITGLIYEGPQLVPQINRGLVRLLRRDGYSSISQAVGADVASRRSS